MNALLIGLLVILQVIILDGILSIDNVAALAGIASQLPKQQQGIALRIGILGAYFFRGLMLLFASFIITNHWLSILGGIYLLYLGIGHFKNWPMLSFKGGKGSTRFWETVIALEFTDLAFSVDNVSGIAGLAANFWLLLVGVCLSILIMRFAAQLFIKVIEWEPRLGDAAYVLITAIGAEIMLKFLGVPVNEVLQFFISLVIIAGYIVYGKLVAKEVSK